MNDKNPKEVNQVVTSVGNSWVVCHSKSYSGRTYYFNTLTGKAAWNLSEAEIEKAKKRTQILKPQEVAGLDACPEPVEPPSDTPGVSKLCNSQMVHCQYHINDFPVNMACICNQMASMKSEELPLQSPYNSNERTYPVWTIPPAHPIFIAPSLTPVNTPGYRNIFVQSATNMKLSQRFQSQAIDTHQTNGRNESPRKLSNNQFKQRSEPYFQRNLRNSDLRKLLTSKRDKIYNNSRNAEHSLEGNEEGVSDTPLPMNKPVKCKDEEHESVDSWLEEYTRFKDNKLVLAVTSLIKLAPPQTKGPYWYIVPDRNILYDNLTFLSILIDSDNECKLMIPLQVKSELRRTCGREPKARRALDFLEQRIAIGRAIIGRGETFENMNNHIISCCEKLAQKNCHVILLCNDIELTKKQSFITILSLAEMKELLSRNCQESNAKPVFQSNSSTYEETNNRLISHSQSSPSETVKLTHTESKEAESQTSHPITMLRLPTNAKEVEVQTTSRRIIKSRLPTNSREAEVQTATRPIETFRLPSKDTSIQTEPIQIKKPTLVSLAVQTEEISKPCVNASVQTDYVFEGVGDTQNSSSNIDKPKIIRLKRGVSNEIPKNDSASERKQFKWRRRKNSQKPNSESDNNTKNKAAKETETCKVHATTVKQITENKTVNSEEWQGDVSMSSGNNAANDDALESDNNSLINTSAFNNTRSDRIVVEETSTSDIISNSNSYVDTDSIRTISRHLNGSTNKSALIQTMDDTNVVFEIKDEAMEKCLRSRSDEWVSAFIQIMEDVLTQVLRDVSFSDRSMPPPWSVQQATHCIQIKFHDRQEVFNAAKKFSIALAKVSDNEGRISKNLNPSDFMEMFSDGVFLIDALELVVNNYEDLQTASESLSKLYEDIQDPGLIDADATANDSLLDNNYTKDKSPQGKAKNHKESPPTATEISPKDKIPKAVKETPIQPKEQEKPTVKFIRNINIEESFFESLHQKKYTPESHQKLSNIPSVFQATALKCKKIHENIEESGAKDILENIEVSGAKETHENNSGSRTNGIETENANKIDSGKSPVYHCEPKVIMRFTKSSEFEERLKDKPVDMDVLDYEDVEVEYDYSDEENESHKEYSVSNGEYEITPDEGNEDSVGYAKCDTNNNFTCFVSAISSEIKETFVKIQRFCENSIQELQPSENATAYTISNLQKKAERSRVYLQRLLEMFKCVVRREKDKHAEGIYELIKANMDGFALTEEEQDQYREFMETCAAQTDILLESVELVIKATKIASSI